MKKLLLSLGIVCLLITSVFATEWEYILTLDKNEKSNELFDGAAVWIDVNNIFNEFVVDRNILEFWVKFVIDKPKNNISFILAHFVMQIQQGICFINNKDVICLPKKSAIKQLILFNTDGVKISEYIAKTKEDSQGDIIEKDSFADILYDFSFSHAINNYINPNYIPSLKD